MIVWFYVRLVQEEEGYKNGASIAIILTFSESMQHKNVVKNESILCFLVRIICNQIEKKTQITQTQLVDR